MITTNLVVIDYMPSIVMLVIAMLAIQVVQCNATGST